MRIPLGPTNFWFLIMLVTILAQSYKKQILKSQRFKTLYFFSHICKNSMQRYLTGSFTLHGHSGTQAPSTLWPLHLQSLFQSLTGREQNKGKTHLLLIHSEPKKIHVTSDHIPFMNINCTATPRWQVTVVSILARQPQQQADIMRREHRSGVVSWLWAHLQPFSPSKNCLLMLRLTSRMTVPETLLHFALPLSLSS